MTKTHGSCTISRSTTLASTHRLILGDLTTPIIIRLELDDATGSISVETSHAIKTPGQHNVYVPEVLTYDKTLEEAIVSVIDGYEVYYSQAVEAGLVASETWLVPAME